MTRYALRRALHCVIAACMAGLCGGCVPIGGRWQNMFAALIG